MNIERLVIIREDGFMSINGRGLTIDLADMPPDQQRMILMARNRDAVLEGRRILVVEDDVRNI